MPDYDYIRREEENESQIGMIIFDGELSAKQIRFSASANIDGHHFYCESNGGKLEDKTLFHAKEEIKAGAMWEQRVGEHLFFTVKGRYTFPFLSKIYDANKIMRDKLGKYSEAPNFYFNIGISYITINEHYRI